MLGHNYIGTEHLLLGLLREQEGVGAHALESFGVTLDRVREQVMGIVGRGNEPSSGQIPFTPRAKRTLEVALREALSLGHNHIGTEHLLLAVVSEQDGVAMRILTELGIGTEELREATIALLHRGGTAVRIGIAGPSGEEREELERSWLDGLVPILRKLGREIERDLGRAPDTGDLVLALAAAPATRAGRALAALGLDPDALAREVERARDADGPSTAELVRAIDKTNRAKQSAADQQEFEKAAELRDEEKRLRAALTAGQVDPQTIVAIRARLGLPGR
jgi:ATP-dependent Clp protease ATP-binding subunit ClpA